jgi:hypothetical protein
MKSERRKYNNKLKKNIGLIVVTLALFFVLMMPSITSFPPDPTCLTIIGDYVWEDLNCDGIQDQDEVGIDDVTVELYTCEETFIDSIQTCDGGYYEFIVEPGDYYLIFILLSDYIFTQMDIGSDDSIDSDADPQTGKTECTNLYFGENDFTWDAGMYKTSSIGDFVWEDINENGIQEPEEQGIDDITVELYSCEDIFISSTLTSDGGMYEFSDLEPGDYYVKFILPEYYVFTQQDVGEDDTIDSDADPETGETICFEIDTGMNLNIYDAGMYIVEYYELDIDIVGGCGYVIKIPDYPTYPPGTVVQLTAYPNISGFMFDYWSGDLTGNNNPEFITMDSDKQISAHFTFVEYELLINIDGDGYVYKDPDKDTYHFNDIVTLTAFGNTGWKFDHWSGDTSSDENPIRIQIYYVKNITAHFTYFEYSLNVFMEGNGTVIKSPDYSMYPDGSIVELNAEAYPGWKFDHWSGDTTGSNNPEYITIDGEKTVTAHFVRAKSPVRPTITGPQKIKAGEESYFTVYSKDPYDSDIYYYVEWGDGDIEDWIGPFKSDKKIVISHTWTEGDFYTIKVKARNMFYSESNWGRLDITLPINKVYQTNILSNLFIHFLRSFPLFKLLINVI